MKNTWKWLFLITVGFYYSEFCLAQGTPTLEPYALTTGYIPQGFDDNDNVQVTAEGWFRDTCYKSGPVRTRVADGAVVLQQWAYRYLGICLYVMVPFHQTVDLGLLKPGGYQVIDGVSGKGLGALPIAHAKSSNPDDFLYAPVSDAVLDNHGIGLGIVVTGLFSDSCMYFKDIRARIVGNVIEVLPIAGRASLNKCNRGFYPFQKTVSVERPLPGRYLLHVRSLEGKAINKLVDVY